jgi:hypothetical protein
LFGFSSLFWQQSEKIHGFLGAPTTTRATSISRNQHPLIPASRQNRPLDNQNEPTTGSFRRSTSTSIRYPSQLLLRATNSNDAVNQSSGQDDTDNNNGTFRRLASIGAVMVSSFATYLLGTLVLNRTLVQRMGVSRSGDAFGPFATLLSLIYSIVLGQIYHYYFERQQIIQNCLYEEAAALQILFHVCRCQGPTTSSQFKETDPQSRVMMMCAPLKAYTQSFIQTAFSKTTSRMLSQESPRMLIELADAYDKSNNDNSSSSSSPRCLMVANAIQAATSARALRISHVNSELPAVQRITIRLLSYVILLGFVLVDLKAPVLEALLFSVIAGCFTTIHGFLMDLSDPFTGHWSVGRRIRKDLDDLIRLMM